MKMKNCKNQTILLGTILGLMALTSTHAADLTLQITDLKGKPVENTVFLARSSSGLSVSKPMPRAQITQKNRTFFPLVTLVTVGTEVEFPNRDSVQHHVYSFSPAKTFDIPLYKDSSPPPLAFDKPGVVVLGCNIHDWMKAYIYVADTPYCGLSGADGSVKLTGIPAGTYALEVWHPRLRKIQGTPIPATIKLVDDKPTTLNATLELKREIAPDRSPSASEETYH
ncbi:MAG: methylamine utilization protein [Candidatus Ozemobacteraceae bacterium]